MSCYDCPCRSCLLWWSSRCPYGSCFDDHRAKVQPWPGPERRSWSDWNLPGEQAHWCRGGAVYPAEHCDHYVEYDPDRTVVKSCLDANVVIYQDGHIQCSIIDAVGCEECYRRFNERTRDL